MSMKIERFGAFLNDRMEADSSYLPLCAEATADLLNLLSEADDYIFLSISDDQSYEVVKCRNEGGTLLVERGIEGTTASLHGFGACVSSVSPLTVAVIKDLVCNYDCCKDGDCPCEPVSFAMSFIPYAKQGQLWEGFASFSGNMPMTLGANGAPAWMQIEVEGNTVKMSGTPTTVGTVSFAVAATNCNGTSIATHVVSFDVQSADV